jgi:tRNA-uridine 2-sulfurtransferase
MMQGRVAVAMSGGVDSSAAAAILKAGGCRLVGFSMQLWDQKRHGSDPAAGTARCCSLEDIYDARAVAARLGFPYYVVNFQEEFEQTIVRSFIEDYRNGLTPSPCVLCNSRMKFSHLLRVAQEVGAGRVATGHYARVARDEQTGRYQLLRARHRAKDQSYFLFELNQAQLARAIFPLGELTKSQVREVAKANALEVSEKAESQEICFVSDGDYAGFIEKHYADVTGDLDERDPFPKGDIVDLAGNVLGGHSGIHHFTVGQRRGLGIARGAPLYVVELRPSRRQVVVGSRAELAKGECRVVRLNWISIPELRDPLRVEVKIRSRHREAAATLSPLKDGSIKVEFDMPQLAVTPGQACVFYQGDVTVGGGWIAR